MDLYHRGKTRIKLQRYQPHRINTCRIAVATNAVNYFRDKQVFNTREVLEIFQKKRALGGLSPLDLDNDSFSDEEVNLFIDEFGGGIGALEVQGKRFLNPSLWRKILDAGFILVADHQMLYVDPKILVDKNFDYLPAKIVEKAVYESEFSYPNLVELYKFFFAYNGQLDEGHVDIVLDVKKVKGLESVIFANLSLSGNKYPIYVPWDLFCNYLAFDWAGTPIRDFSRFPSEEEFRQMMFGGEVRTKKDYFFYGCCDVYYPRSKKSFLIKILQSFGIDDGIMEE